jgi:hypothetical protein
MIQVDYKIRKPKVKGQTGHRNILTTQCLFRTLCLTDIELGLLIHPRSRWSLLIFSSHRLIHSGEGKILMQVYGPFKFCTIGAEMFYKHLLLVIRVWNCFALYLSESVVTLFGRRRTRRTVQRPTLTMFRSSSTRRNRNQPSRLHLHPQDNQRLLILQHPLNLPLGIDRQRDHL